ncbi:hypothetical protein BN971_04249 [Mycobacterium bohemicum DSM 44277]|uniref:Uncharacterized protein n=2 Tax=Mycobacterium bohemicum TaxID=56425 RepID=A0A1X1RAG5_MYCBE|nr:hypothetical protein [Mycobacterium bohemicum]MCV6968594.1 hypothetical protein [Mycobacterium bohemicum]ORV02207.1 hypothetical protein AWB93_05075 [Mycobacterium bohemicum]CPR12942.1 hypothetical protein BN971_04249 [Mycobacterium bohemicum DSM 44277]
MAFVASHRFPGRSLLRGLATRLAARRALTPQARAELYVSRMPIAVVTASLGGHPAAGGGRDHR